MHNICYNQLDDQGAVYDPFVSSITTMSLHLTTALIKDEPTRCSLSAKIFVVAKARLFILFDSIARSACCGSNESTRIGRPVVWRTAAERKEMAPQYKLSYFNVRGRGELARLVMHAAGVEFEDHRFEMDGWAAVKPSIEQLI